MNFADSLDSVVRDMVEDDKRLIYDSWTEALRKRYRFMPPSLYRQAMKQKITHLLQSPETKVKVLASREDDVVIYSYVVWRERPGIMAIEFAYTKHFAARCGLMKRLIESVRPEGSQIVVVCDSPFFDSKDSYSPTSVPILIHLKDRHGVIFNPFLWEMVE
jgi:hypothetical protein